MTKAYELYREEVLYLDKLVRFEINMNDVLYELCISSI